MFHGHSWGIKERNATFEPESYSSTTSHILPQLPSSNMISVSALLAVVLFGAGAEAATTKCVKTYAGVLATNSFSDASGECKCVSGVKY